jgi:hypothetical protein
MDKQLPDDYSGLLIDFIPDQGEVLDDDWQQECKRLKSRLETELESLDVEVVPMKTQPVAAEGETHRALEMTIFSTLGLLLTGVADLSSAASTIKEILQPWLSKRAGCKAIIRTADGSEFVLNDLTKEEIMELMKKRGVDGPDTCI